MKIEFMIVGENVAANVIDAGNVSDVPAANDKVVVPEMDADHNIGLTVEYRLFLYDEHMNLYCVQVWCKRNPA